MNRNRKAKSNLSTGRPSDELMEDIVCDGYFPFLTWELLRWTYPDINYGSATEMFLSAMWRANQKGRLYSMVPPHINRPRVKSRFVGNVFTGERLEYWDAESHEIVSYFRNWWPAENTKGQALADHQDEHWPFFCFPMPIKDFELLRKQTEADLRVRTH